MPYIEEKGLEDSFYSKKTLNFMPSYLGEYEPRGVHYVKITYNMCEQEIFK